MSERKLWLNTMYKVIDPVLKELANNNLKLSMLVEAKDVNDRKQYTYLEAFGRTLVGIAPWLETTQINEEEEQRRQYYANLARIGIDNATNPEGLDYMNFTIGGQPLVDAAFFAQALIKAPKTLWEPLNEKVKQNVISCFKETRKIKPYKSNWLLFSAMIEAFMKMVGEPYDLMRVDYALMKHNEWYVGDGMYSDGEYYHYDYYNSYVIHPMLLDISNCMSDVDNEVKQLQQKFLCRSKRYAEILERLISPGGYFPATGRSIAYRTAAFQLLAHVSLIEQLPKSLTHGQVRNALTQVIIRTLHATSTFDENGWLQLGLSGHQPNLAEHYVSTGSLYLCTTIFLPLGLNETHSFWSKELLPMSSEQLWKGNDFPLDTSINDC